HGGDPLGGRAVDDVRVRAERGGWDLPRPGAGWVDGAHGQERAVAGLLGGFALGGVPDRAGGGGGEAAEAGAEAGAAEAGADRPADWPTARGGRRPVVPLFEGLALHCDREAAG